jgi:hypothetical protein
MPELGLHSSWYTGIRIKQVIVYINIDILCWNQDYSVHGIHKHDILCRDQDYTVHSKQKHEILCGDQD